VNARLPANYRPGALLARLGADLGTCERRVLEATAAEFSSAPLGLTFEVRERVETHFLMHIVVAQFVFAIPGAGAGSERIRIRHRGALMRTGVEFIATDGACAVIPHLQADQNLSAALIPLDFTHCELTRDGSGWRMHLQHYGASEVVGRVPALRRYVPLVPEQRTALLASFAATQRVLLQHTCSNARFS
jgi:hypothetical protein